jgi:hypothetical protein
VILAWSLLVGAGLAGAVAFIGLYAVGSRGWHRTALGRNLMAMPAVLAGLFAVTLASMLLDLPPWVWLGGMASLDAVLWWRVVLLWRAQHSP